MKLSDWFKSSEVSLMGRKMYGKTISENTPNEKWDVDFDCQHNHLTSLKGAPKEVNNFWCSYNSLTSLVGAPRIVNGDFECLENWRLKSLDGIPEVIHGSFTCESKHITSLKDIHNQLKEVGKDFVMLKTPLKSNILGLLKIKGLKKISIDNQKVEEIINKYLPEGDLFDCQDELIDAGFGEYAKL